MAAPIKLSQRIIADTPYEVWNAFVHICAMEQYDDLTPIQRKAHLAFWYEHEVSNGGHLQYFENRGIGRVDETIAALRELRGECHAQVLSEALEQYRLKTRRRIRTVVEFVRKARQGEYDQFDSRYYDCQPQMTQLFEAFLARHERDFVERCP